MPEHFTHTTVEACFWCKKCGKPTMHFVASGRRGGCKACIAKQEALPKKNPPAKQGGLFS